MNFAARIAELQAQLESANAATAVAQGQAQQNFTDLTAARAEILVLTGDLASVRADLLAVRAELATATGTNTTLSADLVTVRAELATEQGNRETLIFDQVNVRLAAAGVAPIKRDPAGPDTPAGQVGARTGTPRQRLAAGFTVAGQS